MLTPYRRQRPLMPQDREIMRILGIGPREYRRFLAEVERACRAQPAEGPVAFDLFTAFVVSLVVGFVLTAASILLAPKPQQSRSPRTSTKQIDGQDIVRSDRFAAKSGFDSLQNVVELGSIIPLIYAKRETIGGVSYGGIRVNVNLLWSQMLSAGGGQLFRGIYMLGQGGIQEIDPLQFAFGDNLLSGYGIDNAGIQTAKVTFYGRLNGGRLKQTDYISGRQASQDDGNFQRRGAGDIYQIPNAANSFAADASGAFKPNNQTQFGVYAPIPSCMTYRVNPSFRPMWQPQTVIRNGGKNFVVVCNRDLQVQTDRWRDQCAFSTRIHFPAYGNGSRNLAAGTDVVMRISKATDGDHEFILQEDSKGNTSNNDDGKDADAVTSCLSAGQTIAGRQAAADDSISIGERYMLGSAIAICTERTTEPFVSNADSPKFDNGRTVNATFRIIKSGSISNYQPWAQNDSDAPTRGPLLTATNSQQSFRLAIANVTLGRRARVIEVGIRSTLGIRINGLFNFRDARSLRRIDRRACLKYQYDKNANKPSGVGGGFGNVEGWPVYRTAKGDAASQVTIDVTEQFTATGQADQNGNVQVQGQIVTSNTGNVVEPNDDDQDNAEFFRNAVFQSGTIQAPEERYSFWRIRYRRAGGNANWTTTTNLYGARGQTQQPIYNFLRIVFPSTDDWEFGFVPVTGFEARNATGGSMCVLDFKKGEISVSDSGLQIRFQGELVSRTRKTFRIPYFEDNEDIGEQEQPDGVRGNVYPAVIQDRIDGRDAWNYVDGWDKLAEIFMYQEITTSAQNGPEHEISYVNIFEDNATVPQYDGLAIVGMNLRSGAEITQLNQLSAYVLRGLADTHLFPEVLLDMLTNTAYSSRGTLPARQINTASFAAAATFTRNRRYFCDIALSEPINRREWAQEIAQRFLLDLVTRNGQLYLEPAFNFTGPEQITGLFTAGNIIEDSLEIVQNERADLRPVRISVKWRQERQSSVASDRGLFPLLREVTVRQSTTPADAELIRIDMSDYCTSQAHAVDAAKYECLKRVYQKRGVAFRTWPHAGRIIPGRCFQVGVEFIDYEAPANGVIGPDGTVTSWPPMADGTYTVLLWRTGAASTIEQQLVIAGGKASPPLAIFAVKQAVEKTLTFKALRVSLNEEAEVEVEGVEFPLNAAGGSRYADGFDTASNWIIEGAI